MSDIKEKKGYGDINMYSILTRVGRGKYSNVFKGKIKNGSYCVIKVLKPVRNEKIKREINRKEKRGETVKQSIEEIEKKRDCETGH